MPQHELEEVRVSNQKRHYWSVGATPNGRVHVIALLVAGVVSIVSYGNLVSGAVVSFLPTAHDVPAVRSPERLAAPPSDSPEAPVS